MKLEKDNSKACEYNSLIESQGYPKKIEQMNRELTNVEKQRTEFLNKLESCHHASSCKL